MGFRDREKMKQNLLKRTEDDYNRQGGGSRHLRTDMDIPLWRPQTTKEDPHIIDVLPYIVGSKQPPLAMGGQVRQGDDAYVLEVDVHQNIGPGKQYILCPAKNYGKPCPICECIEQMVRDGAEWEDYSDIATKKRCLYNVVVMDTEKTKMKGVQIWEVSSFYSQDKIKLLCKNPRTGGFVIFQHPDADTGKSIAFEVAADKRKTHQGHKFLDRNYDIPDETLDQAFRLDELLMLQPYEYIKSAMLGGGEEEASEPRTSGASQEKAKEEPVQETRRGRDRAAASTSNPCPNNLNFGIDIDSQECCKACEDATYQKCCEKADQLDDEKKKAEEEAAKAAAAAQNTGGGGRRLLRRNQ